MLASYLCSCDILQTKIAITSKNEQFKSKINGISNNKTYEYYFFLKSIQTDFKNHLSMTWIFFDQTLQFKENHLVVRPQKNFFWQWDHRIGTEDATLLASSHARLTGYSVVMTLWWWIQQFTKVVPPPSLQSTTPCNKTNPVFQCLTLTYVAVVSFKQQFEQFLKMGD